MNLQCILIVSEVVASKTGSRFATTVWLRCSATWRSRRNKTKSRDSNCKEMPQTSCAPQCRLTHNDYVLAICVCSFWLQLFVEFLQSVWEWLQSHQVGLQLFCRLPQIRWSVDLLNDWKVPATTCNFLQSANKQIKISVIFFFHSHTEVSVF